MMSKTPTYNAFPPTSRADWQQQAERESKGTKPLDTFEREGLVFTPFYTQEDTPALSGVPLSDRPWQYHAYVDEASDEEVRHHLHFGADGVIVRHPSLKQWQKLLHSLGSATEPATHLSLASHDIAPYLDTYETHQQALAEGGHTLRGTLYAHPLERWCQHQHDYQPVVASLADYLRQADAASAIRALAVDGGIFFEQGLNVVDELGYTLSLLIAYYDLLTDQGVAAATLWNHTEITLATGSDYYVDLIKFRAIRLLLVQVAEAYQVSEASRIPLRAVSGWRNKTLYDANSNLLRNTTEAMAALLGGADVITLLPHNALHPTASDFGERMAVNVVNILRHEAHLEKVSDPAAGSYFLESLTQQLVEKAWAKFLEIEDAGGFVETVTSGKMQSTATNAWEKRANQVQHQQTVLIGANKYALANESLAFALEEPLPPRLVWEAEQVRYQVDQQVAQGQPRPHWQVYVQPDAPSINTKVKFITQLLPLGGMTYERQTWTGKNPASSQATVGAIFCGDDAFYQEIAEMPPLSTNLWWMVGAAPNETIQSSRFIDPQQDIVTLLRQLLQSWYHEA